MTFALEGLAPVDGWVLAAIVAKALGYAAALVAMGGPLFLIAFERGRSSAPRAYALGAAPSVADATGARHVSGA